MIDPQLQVMFNSMILPLLRQMPTDALCEIRDALMAEINNELAKRALASGQ